MMKRKIILKTITLSLLTISSGCYGDFTYVAGGSGFVDGFVKDAKFSSPDDLTVDEKTGDLYFIDQDAKAIRKITPDGKVSTVFKVSFVVENYLKSPQVKDNYLYFIYNKKIKRLDLSKKESKYEDYLDPNSETILNSFHFLSNGTMLLHEDKDLKIANLETKEIKKLNLKSKIGDFLTYGSKTIIGDIHVKENPKTKDIFLAKDNTTIYKITKDNEIVLFSNDRSLYPISGFDFDKDGNIYTISINREKLIKVSLSGEIKEISNLIGLINFNPKQDGFVQLTNLFFISICLDRKRNILYIAPSEDRIFKINLDKEIK